MGDRDGPSPGLVGGLVRAAGSLLSVHVQHAQREASSDAGRMVGGAVLLVAGAVFVVLAVLVGHGAAIHALQQHTVLDWLQSMLAVAGADLLIALVLLLSGRAKLRGPVMKETRQLVRRTVQSLTDG